LFVCGAKVGVSGKGAEEKGAKKVKMKNSKIKICPETRKG
jgi:hypothetical protein